MEEGIGTAQTESLIMGRTSDLGIFPLEGRTLPGLRAGYGLCAPSGRTLLVIQEFNSELVSVPKDYARALGQCPRLSREVAGRDSHGGIGPVVGLSGVDRLDCGYSNVILPTLSLDDCFLSVSFQDDVNAYVVRPDSCLGFISPSSEEVCKPLLKANSIHFVEIRESGPPIALLQQLLKYPFAEWPD